MINHNGNFLKLLFKTIFFFFNLFITRMEPKAMTRYIHFRGSNAHFWCKETLPSHLQNQKFDHLIGRCRDDNKKQTNKTKQNKKNNFQNFYSSF